MKVTMKFYYYTCDADHYGFLRFTEAYTHESGFPVSDQFDRGKSISSSWQTVVMEVNTSQGPLGDFPVCPMGPPVLSQKAWSVLEPMIGDAVEALPVITPVGIYFALNVMDVVDCLDYGQSEMSYYPASMDGGLHRIIKCQLNSDLIKHKDIFKIPERMTQAIVSENFKRVSENELLNGLNFTRILYETDSYYK